MVNYMGKDLTTIDQVRAKQHQRKTPHRNGKKSYGNYQTFSSVKFTLQVPVTPD